MEKCCLVSLFVDVVDDLNFKEDVCLFIEVVLLNVWLLFFSCFV